MGRRREGPRVDPATISGVVAPVGWRRAGSSSPHLRAFAIGLARRPSAQRRVRARFVVEVDPRADDALGVGPVPELVEVHRLVLQRPPQPLDEDVVEEARPRPSIEKRTPAPSTRSANASLVNWEP